MKTTPTAHDALFKQFLTHPETARDFLEVHLPPALRQACDLNTLRLESGRDADLVVVVNCQIPSDDLVVHFF